MIQLDEHQTRVVTQSGNSNLLLIWEPGVGKTAPCVELAFQKRWDGPTLVICPANIRTQWQAVIRARFPEMRACVLTELNRTVPERVFEQYDVIICSYEYVSCFPRWKQLRTRRWAYMVIDEAHYLINQKAGRTRAILGKKMGDDIGLYQAADNVWALTGTPFTYPNDVYALLSRLFPDAVEDEDLKRPLTLKEWTEDFCVVSPYGKIVGARNIRALRGRLAPCIDKVKLSEVHPHGLAIDHVPIIGDIPEIPEHLLAHYNKLRALMMDYGILDAEKLKALEEAGMHLASLRNHIAAAKVGATTDYLRNQLEKVGSHGERAYEKIILFGWHREPLKAVAREFGNAPLVFGSMTEKQKAQAKERFIEDPSCEVFCGQIETAGVGFDGLQHVAHRAVFMEASWRHLHNKQAVGRIYRRGQKTVAYATFLYLVDSIDDIVTATLARKAHAVSEVLD